MLSESKNQFIECKYCIYQFLNPLIVIISSQKNHSSGSNQISTT